MKKYQNSKTTLQFSDIGESYVLTGLCTNIDSRLLDAKLLMILLVHIPLSKDIYFYTHILLLYRIIMLFPIFKNKITQL